MAGGHAGPRYFARGGKGTWIGLTSDIAGKCITPYQDKPSEKTATLRQIYGPALTATVCRQAQAHPI